MSAAKAAFATLPKAAAAAATALQTRRPANCSRRTRQRRKSPSHLARFFPLWCHSSRFASFSALPATREHLLIYSTAITAPAEVAAAAAPISKLNRRAQRRANRSRRLVNYDHCCSGGGGGGRSTSELDVAFVFLSLSCVALRPTRHRHHARRGRRPRV